MLHAWHDTAACTVYCQEPCSFLQIFIVVRVARVGVGKYDRCAFPHKLSAVDSEHRSST